MVAVHVVMRPEEHLYIKIKHVVNSIISINYSRFQYYLVDNIIYRDSGAQSLFRDWWGSCADPGQFVWS